MVSHCYNTFIGSNRGDLILKKNAVWPLHCVFTLQQYGRTPLKDETLQRDAVYRSHFLSLTLLIAHSVHRSNCTLLKLHIAYTAYNSRFSSL